MGFTIVQNSINLTLNKTMNGNQRLDTRLGKISVIKANNDIARRLTSMRHTERLGVQQDV